LPFLRTLSRAQFFLLYTSKISLSLNYFVYLGPVFEGASANWLIMSEYNNIKYEAVLTLCVFLRFESHNRRSPT
jgi:hypothetical protein